MLGWVVSENSVERAKLFVAVFRKQEGEGEGRSLYGGSKSEIRKRRNWLS